MKRFLLLFFIAGFYILQLFSANNAEAAVDEHYKVGVNDVVEVRVLDHPELHVGATVTVDGSITMPYIGAISAEGMTLAEIREEITKKLSEGYIKYPVVTVSLLKSMSQKIYGYGMVYARGEVPYEKDMTLEKALTVLRGVTSDGLFGKIVIRRREKDSIRYKEIIETDLDNGNIVDREAADMLLKPDDIFIVKRNDTYLIQGEAAQRGRFVLEKNMTVLSAILQAGGISKDGLYGKLYLRRKQANGFDGYINIMETKINDGVLEDKNVENTILQPDDIIFVERNKTVLVQGEVLQRGRIVLEKNMTVLSALLQVGGVTDGGQYGNILIRRKQDNKDGLYKTILQSKLNGGVIENVDVENAVLQPDDVLLVESNEKYFVYGEVNRTGEFVLNSDMTVLKAITLAGGFTRWGSEDRIKILRQDKDSKKLLTIRVKLGDVIDGDSSADVYLQAGDIIIAYTGIL